MNRNFAMEFVRVTEAAALESARMMGRGDEKAADQAAVTAMRKMLNSVEFDGRVVIGEGERDEAPMLYIGEKVGKGNGPRLDLALDPLEGTTICARGGNNSLAVIAICSITVMVTLPASALAAVRANLRGAIRLGVMMTVAAALAIGLLHHSRGGPSHEAVGDGPQLNAASILSLMGLAASKGTVVTLRSDAPGADAALDDLAALLETDLDAV